jgi:hypothetical protein
MSSRGYGPKYTPGHEIEEMTIEIAMMHEKYESLCKAYKRLAQSKGLAPAGDLENTTKDFGEWEKEKQEKLGDRYGN